MKELRGFELTGTNIPNFYPWHILDKDDDSIDARSDVFEIRIFNGVCEPFADPVYKQFSWWLQSGGNT